MKAEEYSERPELTNLTVAVDISFADHFVDFVVC